MQIQDWKARIPADFPPDARVWIYQAGRPFNEREEKEIEEQLYQFYVQWQAHGKPVKGWAGLLFRQFIVLMADETVTEVSGCSTDTSVRVIKSIERQYNVSLFDRMTLTFLVEGKPQMLPFGQVQHALDGGHIGQDTLVFNNIARTKQELLDNWLVPVRQSWLAGRVQFA
jgi:hypothetical protein